MSQSRLNAAIFRCSRKGISISPKDIMAKKATRNSTSKNSKATKKKSPASNRGRLKTIKTSKSKKAKGSTNGQFLTELHEWRGHTTAGAPWTVHHGDSLKVLKSLGSCRFSCVVTSPPYYWLRDYGMAGQLGQEATIQQYVDGIADVMDEVKRVVAENGCLFLNLGDTYYSGKGRPHGKDPKNKARRMSKLRAVDASGLGVPRKTTIGIPWRVALEMISRGWTLRSPIIWRREGAIPEPTAKDRPWRTYETIFLFSKTPKYYFNREALGGEEDIWLISERPKSSNGLHSAAFPDRLAQKCLDVGCPENGEVLDPFVGTGTVLRTAAKMKLPSVGIDLNRSFCEHTVEMLHDEKWNRK